MTRDWLARVTLSCSCGGTLEPVCLLDRAQSGDRDAWAEIQGRHAFSGIQSDRGRRGAARRKMRSELADLSADELADHLARTGNSAATAVLSPGGLRAAEQRVSGHDLPF